MYASVAALLPACSDGTGPDPDPGGLPGDLPAGAFQVSPATVTLQPGQTFRFTTTYSGNPALVGTPGDAAWQSSDEKVASVAGGLVRAVSGGEARIVTIWGGYQATALVRVAGPAKKHEDAIACIKRAPSAEQKLIAQC